MNQKGKYHPSIYQARLSSEGTSSVEKAPCSNAVRLAGIYNLDNVIQDQLSRHISVSPFFVSCYNYFSVATTLAKCTHEQTRDHGTDAYFANRLFSHICVHRL
jgi:hypothetical protein